MTLTETPIIQTLKSRKKWQKLTYKEKLEINKQVNEGTPLRDIWKLFQVSLSTIKKIVKDFDKIKMPSKICSTIKSRSAHNPNHCKAIESFAKQEKRSFTWRDIMEHIMENFNICVDINTIREILIQRLGYSYKRWSPRPLCWFCRLVPSPQGYTQFQSVIKPCGRRTVTLFQFCNGFS